MTHEDILDKALDQYLTNTADKPISSPSRLPHYAAAATAVLAGTHADAAIVELGPVANLIDRSISALSGSSTGSSFTTFRNNFALTSTNSTIKVSVTGSLQQRIFSTGGVPQYSNSANIRIANGSNNIDDVKFATLSGSLRILNPGDQIGYFGSRFIPSNEFIGNAGFASTGTGTFGFVAASNALNPQGFGEARRGLIALSFQKDGNKHYGWIELEYEVDQTFGPGPLGGISLKVDIVNRAWESTPETAIGAGVIPEPGTLGLLALGFTGVLMQRRRKQETA